MEVAKQYPNKRLFVHYDQPYIPFVGPIGRDRLDFDQIADHKLPFWQQPMVGEWNIGDSEIWDAYCENLELTLQHVKQQPCEFDGRTVATSDHGNALGDRSFPVQIREYGPPYEIYMDELTTVAWFVYSYGNRRNIKDKFTSNDISVAATVDDRPENAGYKT